MSLWSAFTGILGQGLAIVTGKIGVNVDGTTITVNGSNQLVASGGGGGLTVIGPFEYINTNSLTDYSSNLYYSTGALLADSNGYLYYSTGNHLADNSGNLYYSNGDILADGSGRLNATGINFASSQTTINGSTSGSTVSSMPFQGSTYKKVVIYVNALVNATSTSYTFPTAFTKTPAITYVPSGDAALITLSTTVVTFAVGTFVSGFVTIEGY